MQVKAPWRPHVSSNVQGDTATTIDATGQQQIQKLQLKPTTSRRRETAKKNKSQVSGLHMSQVTLYLRRFETHLFLEFPTVSPKKLGGKLVIRVQGTFIFVDVFSAEAIPDIQKFT